MRSAGSGSRSPGAGVRVPLGHPAPGAGPGGSRPVRPPRTVPSLLPSSPLPAGPAELPAPRGPQERFEKNSS